MAKKYKLKTDFVKFSVLEGQVLYVERQRHKQAVNALTERDKEVVRAAVQQLEGLFQKRKWGLLRDVNERPLLNAASEMERGQKAAGAVRPGRQTQRKSKEQSTIAEQFQTTEEPDWLKGR